MSEKENNQNIKNENSNLDVDMDDILDIMGSCQFKLTTI